MKKGPAFTLVECVGALIITSLVIILAGLAMTNVRQLSRHSLAGSVDWIICLQELESANHHFELKKVERYQLVLRDQQQQRDYQLRIRDRLYLRAANGGYMPILSGVRGKYSSFRRIDQQRVYIEVERTNGRRDYGIACFAKAD